MAEIQAWRGLRFNIAKVGDLSDVVAPPYDVIDDALQQKLYDRSPYNVIRLELNRNEPGDTTGDERYGRASSLLQSWRAAEILRAEDHPALYVYEQTYEAEGNTHTRRGFFARVRLERFGEGMIFPHEQTLSGPKADRLKLYEATDTQLSPIFGLYPDPSELVFASVWDAVRDHTPIEVRDHLGVIHRMWVVTDERAHTTAQGVMAGRPIFIADGHHRYETGIAYRDRLEQSGKLDGVDDPANFCCMALVSMSDAGLTILPTHRLASGLGKLSAAQLAELLQPEFDVQAMGTGADAMKEAWQRIEAHGDQDMLGFGTVSDGTWLVARLRSDATMDKLVPEHSPDWRSLGVSILHELVFKHLLKSLSAPTFRYVHLLREVEEAAQSNECDLACLVPPATMEHVQLIASQHETMPPKSTYFYPKMLTGMVLNPLR